MKLWHCAAVGKTKDSGKNVVGTLIVGDWRINFDAGWLEPRRKVLRRREFPDRRLIAVLRVLTLRAGEVVSSKDILSEAWPDRVVSRDSVTTAIYELRQILGDVAASPSYIRTEPRRGYRLIAPVEHPVMRMRFGGRRVAAAAIIGLAIIGTTFVSQVDQRQPMLQIGPIRDVSRDAQIATLANAIDATLRSALIRLNPGRVTTATDIRQPVIRLQSEIVACDLGPALVIQLLDLSEDRYVWSRTYSLDFQGIDPTLVEQVANDVSVALSRR